MSGPARAGPVIALTGGVGGAKLALGLYRVLPADALTVIVNTADDFEHLGLHVSPDLDTLLYTLAGLANPETGWGRAGETWSFLAALEALGGEHWFRLGDADLATHVERTRRLRAGQGLGEVAEAFRRRLGIGARVLPMSDDPVRTWVDTDEGWLAFQHYFVRRRCEPRARGFAFRGADGAKPLPALLSALGDPDARAIVICPSNPFVSIEPILAVPGVRAALAAAAAPVVAVAPIVGGAAVKGPTAKMMRELDLPVTPAAVAARYAGLIDGYVVDLRDAGAAGAIDVPVDVTDTLMLSLADRERLAGSVLAFAARLASDG